MRLINEIESSNREKDAVEVEVWSSDYDFENDLKLPYNENKISGGRVIFLQMEMMIFGNNS